MASMTRKTLTLAPAIGSIVTIHDGGAIHAEYDGTLTRWRVNSYMKDTPKPIKPNWIDDILFKSCQKVGSAKRRLMWCNRAEAQYVACSGVCGTIARISDCKVVGMVNWTPARIKEAEQSASRFVGQMLF